MKTTDRTTTTTTTDTIDENRSSTMNPTTTTAADIDRRADLHPWSAPDWSQSDRNAAHRTAQTIAERVVQHGHGDDLVALARTVRATPRRARRGRHDNAEALATLYMAAHNAHHGTHGREGAALSVQSLPGEGFRWEIINDHGDTPARWWSTAEMERLTIHAAGLAGYVRADH